MYKPFERTRDMDLLSISSIRSIIPFSFPIQSDLQTSPSLSVATHLHQFESMKVPINAWLLYFKEEQNSITTYNSHSTTDIAPNQIPLLLSFYDTVLGKIKEQPFSQMLVPICFLGLRTHRSYQYQNISWLWSMKIVLKRVTSDIIL